MFADSTNTDYQCGSVLSAPVCHLVIQFGKTIADAPHGQDVAWLGRVRLDLFAQTMDVHGDCAVVGRVLIAPYAFEQLVAAEDLSRVAGEEVQQLELGAGQRHALRRGPPRRR